MEHLELNSVIGFAGECSPEEGCPKGVGPLPRGYPPLPLLSPCGFSRQARPVTLWRWSSQLCVAKQTKCASSLCSVEGKLAGRGTCTRCRCCPPPPAANGAWTGNCFEFEAASRCSHARFRRDLGAASCEGPVDAQWHVAVHVFLHLSEFLKSGGGKQPRRKILQGVVWCLACSRGSLAAAASALMPTCGGSESSTP